MDAIQLLRAMAASIVVFGHLLGRIRAEPDIFGPFHDFHYNGGAGVDVFFVISGFIMVLSSRKLFGSAGGAKNFLMRRFFRIIPLYWGVTLLTLALLRIGHGALPGAAAIAASFSFIPYDTMARHDGFVFPVVDLGWTLNYEMMFYVIFAVFISLGRRRCVMSVAVSMTALVLLGMAFHPENDALRFWVQPIILEFVAGMLIANVYLEGKLALGAPLRIALAVISVAIYLADPFGLTAIRQTPNSFIRVFGSGTASALLLVAAVAGPSHMKSMMGRAAVLLGDASYALYLLHPFVLAAMVKLAHSSFGMSVRSPIVFMSSTCLFAVLVSVTAHKVIERPVTEFLSRLLRRRETSITTVPLVEV